MPLLAVQCSSARETPPFLPLPLPFCQRPTLLLLTCCHLCPPCCLLPSFPVCCAPIVAIIVYLLVYPLVLGCFVTQHDGATHGSVSFMTVLSNGPVGGRGGAVCVSSGFRSGQVSLARHGCSLRQPLLQQRGFVVRLPELSGSWRPGRLGTKSLR